MSRAGPDAPQGLPPGIEHGLDLFDDGAFFEAHEVMEEVWKRDPRPVRRLWQGLIQAAVACHHVRAANGAGALKMIAAARPKLSDFASAPTGLDLARLLRDLRRLERAVAGGSAPPSAWLPIARRRHL